MSKIQTYTCQYYRTSGDYVGYAWVEATNWEDVLEYSVGKVDEDDVFLASIRDAEDECQYFDMRAAHFEGE